MLKLCDAPDWVWCRLFPAAAFTPLLVVVSVDLDVFSFLVVKYTPKNKWRKCSQPGAKALQTALVTKETAQIASHGTKPSLNPLCALPLSPDLPRFLFPPCCHVSYPRLLLLQKSHFHPKLPSIIVTSSLRIPHPTPPLFSPPLTTMILQVISSTTCKTARDLQACPVKFSTGWCLKLSLGEPWS